MTFARDPATAAYYDRRAAEYDDWYEGTGLHAARSRPGWSDEVAALVALVRGLEPARTLDVACGTGFMTRHHRGEVVGLDQSESMLEVAREQVPDAEFVQGDALDLPFPDGSFDRLFTSYFYCHLEEPERQRFLREARRVALELVVVGTILGAGEEPARWDERVLKDGSRWKVFKRVFVPDELAEELGGRVLHRSRLFVMVAAP